MQLVAYGAQDIYLTGNPQITFFKVVYRRHTNFSMETISQTLSGAGTANGNTSTCTISRNGDLVHKVYVTATPTGTGYTLFDGSKLISEVELEIGGQRIDRHTSEWNDIWNELSTDESKAIGFKAMQGSVGLPGDSGATGVETINVPLNFWFCRNPGLALPLIALQYHEVKLKFKWGNNSDIQTGGEALSPKVWCDYIYLDTDERRRFAQVSHEYLIEQLQIETMTKSSGDKKINFNHPVKELIWTSGADSDYGTAQLKLNGHDRFQKQEREYFQLRQPFDYHSAVPRQNLPSAAQLTSNYVEKQDVGITAITATADSDKGSLTTVSAGKIAVVANDTDPSANDDTSTEITDDATLSTAEVLYIVDKATVGGKLFVGRLYEITLSGTMAATTGNVFATLTENHDGPGTTYASTCSLLRFNALLVKSGTGLLAAGFTGADSAVLTISEINEFVPKLLTQEQARTSKMEKAINVYSFALKPEEHQPSGTCNFSRIDNAQLNFANDLHTSESQNLYAVNYNVLRIMSGMGGLAYSN